MFKIKCNSIYIVFGFLLLSACSENNQAKVKNTIESIELDNVSSSSNTLYHNGSILTMAGESAKFVEVIVENSGEIIFVGALNKAKKIAGNTAKTVDLNGSTLIPGLIEPHLHPSLAAIMLQNEIIAPYDWKLPSGIKPDVSGESAYRERITQSI